MAAYNKEYTISNTSGHCSEEHSRRSYIPFSADKVLTDCNVIIYDCGDDRQHLNDKARPYIQEYNSRQKRKDRKKDYEDDYVAALEDGRACFGKGDKKEKPFHHDVIQIGNREDFGVTDSDFDVHYWRELKKSGKLDAASKYVLEHLNKDAKVNEAIQILCEIAEEIRDNKDNKYSNILVHGLTVHCDEPNGTPHLDFRYSIFTDDEKTGVSWRVSDHKGLMKMGFTTETKSNDGQDTPEMFTALQKFRESINFRIEEKMKEHGWKKGIEAEDLIRFVYQMEFLMERGEVSRKDGISVIKDAFICFSGGHTFSGKKGEPYKTDSVNNFAIRTLIQAVGRICRTGLKNPDIYIYVDNTILSDYDLSFVEQRILNPEFAELVKVGKIYFNGQVNANMDVAVMENRAGTLALKAMQIINELKRNWTDDSIDYWKALFWFE